jgi:serine/threonine-protein kinase
VNPGQAAWLCIVLVCLVGGGLLGARNLRLNRADGRGALRLLLILILVQMISLLSFMHQVPSLAYELSLLVEIFGLFAFWRGSLCVTYLALEPTVRHRWPWRIISWTRLLAGRWRDPLVGRDLLIGGVAGIATGLVITLQELATTGAGSPLNTDKVEYLRRGLVAAVLDSASHGVLLGLYWFFVLVLLLMLLRKAWLVCATTLLLGTLVTGLQAADPSVVQMTCVAVEVGIILFVAMRFGLLASWSTLFFGRTAMRTALTLDFSAWYASNGGGAMVVLTVVAAYGFVVSLGSRPLLGKGFFGEE